MATSWQSFAYFIIIVGPENPIRSVDVKVQKGRNESITEAVGEFIYYYYWTAGLKMMQIQKAALWVFSNE